MKTLIISCMLFIGCNCFGQHKVYKKKYVPKQKINYCKLTLDTDSLYMFPASYNCCGIYHYFKDGTKCLDSTGMAEYNRRKLIGDTTYWMPSFDTSYVMLLTQVDNIKLKTKAIKVINEGQYFRSELYQDTVTKKHIMGNSGWGVSSYPSNKVWPSIYLQLDRKPFPSSIYIYGEIKNN